MTRGLLAASSVVAAALSIGHASSGLMSSLAQRAGTSVEGTDSIAITTPSTLRVPTPTEPGPGAPIVSGAPASDTPSRPTLSMVPGNPKLESRLRTLLPPGMTVRRAAQGFITQRQFVSAVHVSRNLDIPFTRLKAKIVDERLSLGQAIQELRPDADVSKELTRVRDLTTRDLY